MSDEPTHKLVDGILVPLTQQEIDAIKADQNESKKDEAISQPTLDMGRSMNEILNE